MAFQHYQTPAYCVAVRGHCPPACLPACVAVAVAVAVCGCAAYCVCARSLMTSLAEHRRQRT